MTNDKTDKVKMCPHGRENAIYMTSQPCAPCAQETLLKLTQCSAFGHDSGENPVSFYLTAVQADDAPVDACLFRCIRCGVLF